MENRELWERLNMDLEKHDEFLAPVPQIFTELFLNRENRPAGMSYFDAVVGDVHGIRVHELYAMREAGAKVFSTFCVYVPEEIVVATGSASIGLCAGAQFTVPSGEKVLPRNLCPLIKSTMGFKLDRICPYFQISDWVIGETTCDGKKKAWEILNEHIPTYVMDLPQKKDAKDARLWEEEVREFASFIERETKVKLTDENLAQGIEKINHKRQALQRLADLRKHNPAPIHGLDVLLINQLSFFDDPVRFAAQVNALCDELDERVKEGKGAVPADAPRILVTGTPQPLPAWKLHALIEQAGAVVVGEETCTGERYYKDMTEPADNLEDMLANIAKRPLKVNCACFTPNQGRLEDITSMAKNLKADAVIDFNLQFCQSYGIEGYFVAKEMEKQEIPFLRLESDFSEEDQGQLLTRIEALLEMIRA
ncbi:double-cubane-cluster-containing anaerobic reductase [Desulfosporosinus youngiae]|uniref:Benzoyl-CoA reductase/2-hydroxyglutaryl-CoA dehydratase subunit, BcrC/BadD/HgdB n=1 Tax=Desulfosporosinus youngiae DSM 17734 TaxID=768710 RepID=H5XYU2_9FIRM|nr:double-cubane-cluster-containing anaerobic reductase [Desulfosporosinus youngiae]EHQ91648.1 Benzoyl-CoA reductase/2-hydroxyglutaryl-CoA dehydratase subunit, BcrC/BadD/HgdB [Desulfosporosinus youngiae DSM 17734]